ncbi:MULTISPECIES: hypothetical protein [unclassified Cellulomonas]|uniref:hypothetical protein n=1 Tax=unclassified Cellulomonas TaxID=2620175 RepID=UPI001C4E7926|nr:MULTISPECIES: hypothetical protein [unclassified Cellulomonas]MBW0254486.1 hypothetical protein [Cellulomonas sp. PS-H5]MCG7284713.1 hypothetical protein [Cellulomonas sp. ACRRI]
MATTERRPSLVRAPESRNLVEDLVATHTPAPDSATSPPAPKAPRGQAAVAEPKQERASAAAVPPGLAQPAAVAAAAPAAPKARGASRQGAVEEPAAPSYRRGPGRPRNERIMRPLTTTIEIGLRARVDAYAQEHNAKFVDVLDQALRLALDVWEGKTAIVEDQDDQTAAG